MIYSMSKQLVEVCVMDEYQEKIKKIRESTGLNRKEFCEKYDIPYRTMTEWELGQRHAPDYVIRLLAYYIKTQEILKERNTDE